MPERDVRTVCVEFLRPGPAHNQLLSPLTRYLVICGESQAGEVSVPYEHRAFLRRLRDLQYRPETDPSRRDEVSQDRQMTLMELSRDMSRLLAEVPGLQGQLVGRSCETELVHLQVVVTASELAMLPFELAGTLESRGNEPGNYLLLNGRPRVSITRRLRSVSERCVQWPRVPKILFVAASPRQSVPFEQHLAALLRALRHWLPPVDGPTGRHRDGDEAFERVRKIHLHVLEQATMADVDRACSREEFTHVHVLAHGAPDLGSPGQPYGIALHSASNLHDVHVVSGAQFATALRRDGGGSPAIVTLAVCDSGTVKEIVHTGASFVHDLHRAGIPFVVGSQFPLTTTGSVDLCEKLYEGLLLGKDPRQLLCDLRIRLHSVYGGTTHDWASVVAYAVFPADFEDQLLDVEYHQARRAMNVALDHLDREVDRIKDWPADVVESAVQVMTDRVTEYSQRLPIAGRFSVEGLGLLAASRKRTAEALFRASRHLPKGSRSREEVLDRSFDCLEASREAYVDGCRESFSFHHDDPVVLPPLHWLVTQQLSLSMILGLGWSPDLMATARTIAENDERSSDPQSQIWALTSLLELDILQWWRTGKDERKLIIQETRRLLSLVDDESGPIYSTKRQLGRYVEWWWTDEFRGWWDGTHLGERDKTAEVPPELVDTVTAVIAEMERYLRTHQTSIGRPR